MNVQLLIDAIVRQTTALIAQLATAGGVRAPLAHVANQVFLALTTELEAQGVSRKVSADMFGMALRAYQKKIQRLSESSTVRGRSLWEAVLEYLEQSSVVTRGEVLQRFRNDDSVLVRGVLHDLVENGLVSCSGTGSHAVFRKTTDEERAALARNGMGLEEFLWVLVYREGPASREALAKLSGVEEGELEAPLARLQGEQRVSEQGGQWSAREFCVPLGSEAGWEAAMLDHYQALVRTLCARLVRPGERSSLSDATGGSTYTMHVWPGHPYEEEVVGTLGRVRRELAELRRRVAVYNGEHRVPQEYESVVFYAGQSVLEETYSSQNRNGASDDGLSQ
jgi:hypothetical protein